MNVWLVVNTDPVLVLHHPGQSVADDEAAVRAARLISPGTMRGPLGAENAHVTLRLDNRDGWFAQMWADPPLLARATVYLDGVAVFAGTITAVSLGVVATLTVEA